VLIERVDRWVEAAAGIVCSIPQELNEPIGGSGRGADRHPPLPLNVAARANPQFYLTAVR
jgi:hypothetical protein